MVTAVITLSGYISIPRQGHLECARRVLDYLSFMKYTVIRFHTGLLDYSDILYKKHGWENSVYGDVEELKLLDAPEPRGAPLIMMHYIDVNLYYDMLTGWFVTGIMHLINKTPIYLFSKEQTACKTFTYGSK